MKKLIIINLFLLCCTQLIAGVGDKAGGSKGNAIIVDSMKVNFHSVSLPIHKTCLNRENQIQAIENPRLVADREYNVKTCVQLTSYNKLTGGCQQYKTLTYEYPEQFVVTKWKITGQKLDADRRGLVNQVEFAGKERRELPLCEDL